MSRLVRVRTRPHQAVSSARGQSASDRKIVVFALHPIPVCGSSQGRHHCMAPHVCCRKGATLISVTQRPAAVMPHHAHSTPGQACKSGRRVLGVQQGLQLPADVLHDSHHVLPRRASSCRTRRRTTRTACAAGRSRTSRNTAGSGRSKPRRRRQRSCVGRSQYLAYAMQKLHARLRAARQRCRFVA